MSQVFPTPLSDQLTDALSDPCSEAGPVRPQVFIRDDDDEKEWMAYDRNFVETEKFEYIMPVNDTKNFFYDPYVTFAVVFAPFCTGVELLKGADKYKGKEWKEMCCMLFKSVFCFP